jgi:hypothetical protein
MAAKKQSKKKVYSIVTDTNYSIYFGVVTKVDRKHGVAYLDECRQVNEWYGANGGITSLGAFGLCGPRAEQSLIGAPVNGFELGQFAHAFKCTDEAAQTFISFTATKP